MHLKIKEFKISEKSKKRTLIQIIDMSDKILYNEAKAEKNFATLMNGAVSHELRNPLSSLVAGIELMNSYLENLESLIECFDQGDEDQIRIIKQKVSKVLINLGINSKKMNSSSKFIDYFVHDMLDYTILSNDKKNFIK